MCSHVRVSVTPVACVKISAGQLQKLDVGEALHLCSDIQASHVLHVVSGQVVGAGWDRLQGVGQNDDLWGAVDFVDLQHRTSHKGHFTHQSQHITLHKSKNYWRVSHHETATALQFCHEMHVCKPSKEETESSSATCTLCPSKARILK